MVAIKPETFFLKIKEINFAHNKILSDVKEIY